MPPNTAIAEETAQVNGTSGESSNHQPEEIWSTILKSVVASKIVPTKNVLVLGDTHSGKSTLIRHLKLEEPDSSSHDVGTGTEEDKNGPNATDGDKKNEMALSYTFSDVKDEENEDIIARLSFYQLASSHPSFAPLLRFVLNADSLPDSLVVIVLDWSRPWTFVETFERWVRVLHSAVDAVSREGAAGKEGGWTRGKAILDEMRERIESYIQNYVEPPAPDSDGAHGTTSVTNSAIVDSSHVANVTLPLGPGILTENLGIPLIVVCNKSDLVTKLERELDYKDDEFDFIQQTLRTVCLKYGAALFYTSNRKPETYSTLRNYIIHRHLYTSLSNTSAVSSAGVKPPYAFTSRARVVEREVIIVPAGWDSWNKINVLREGYDCDGVSRGWELDVKGTDELVEAEARGEIMSARRIFAEVIADREHAVDNTLTVQATITAEDEQVFFEKHLETLQRTNPGAERPGLAGQGNLPSVVGPIGMPASVINLPGLTTQEIDADDVAARLARLTKLKPTSSASSSQTSSTPSSSAVTSPNLTTGGAGAGSTPSQNEVLANFFQSLLYKKGSGGGNSPSVTSVGSAGSPAGTSPPSRKDVQKELEKMRSHAK
ncbi:uncharacterized protein VTP21DRAFT_3186 [Calcarisporiella thermophila]|uniref:uncharacterized protein n=1 Tax=Calcarisporiella thermophila TaxID=911321 RepID=UPI0037424989